MIRHDVEQGGIEWLALRLGKPTASQFSRIMTPKTMKRGTAADTYMAELLAEWMVGQPLDWDATAWMQRGTGLEAEARKWYEFETDMTVKQVGFFTDDADRYGCSLDGEVEGPVAVEIKCLGAKEHVQCLLQQADGRPITDHYAQCQGQLYLTGWERCDLVLYHPTLPKLILPQTPDDIWRGNFAPILDGFCAELAEQKEKMIARGWHAPDDGVSSWLKRALEGSLAGVS